MWFKAVFLYATVVLRGYLDNIGGGYRVCYVSFKGSLAGQF